MTDRIKVFWIEPIDRERRWLRRYTSSSEHKCSVTGHYCNAMFELGEADIRYTADGYIDGMREQDKPPTTDPRWPTKCEACGRPFEAMDAFQLFGSQIYIRPDQPSFRCTLHDAPPGACWNAWWIADRRKVRSVAATWWVRTIARSPFVALMGTTG